MALQVWIIARQHPGESQVGHQGCACQRCARACELPGVRTALGAGRGARQARASLNPPAPPSTRCASLGATQAEWFMEGLLERLTSGSDAVARALLRQAVVYAVPNMNPDGSYRGHLRTNAAGGARCLAVASSGSLRLAPRRGA
jgi:hypothetical protein